MILVAAAADALPDPRTLRPAEVDDLRTALGEGQLARVVAEVVDEFAWTAEDAKEVSVGWGDARRAALLTLLVYGYAAGIYSSLEIEALARRDSVLRFVGLGYAPDFDTLRRFRRTQRVRLTRCLAAVLQRVNAEASWPGGATPDGGDYLAASMDRWLPAGVGPSSAEEAERRVQRALQADTIILDD
jgi:hypothetical protein